MILKFEHRVYFSFVFQNDAYINMDNVTYIEVIRTRIRFGLTNERCRYYWVPRTEHNMKILNDYLKEEDK